MAGHKFQAMDCLMFQNQKVTQSASQSVTRSPIELFWTAKKKKKKLCLQIQTWLWNQLSLILWPPETVHTMMSFYELVEIAKYKTQNFTN